MLINEIRPDFIFLKVYELIFKKIKQCRLIFMQWKFKGLYPIYTKTLRTNLMIKPKKISLLFTPFNTYLTSFVSFKHLILCSELCFWIFKQWCRLCLLFSFSFMNYWGLLSKSLCGKEGCFLAIFNTLLPFLWSSSIKTWEIWGESLNFCSKV